MTTRHRTKAMYSEERRAFGMLSHKVNRELALVANLFSRPTRMGALLETIQGGPEVDNAFRELVLSASVDAVKDKLAADGVAPRPFQAEVAGAQIAQALLIAREERHRVSALIEPDFRILRLIVLACWEVQAAQTIPDCDLPRSLVVDLIVARALGLDLLDLQMTVAFAKGLLVANETVRDVWPAFRTRIGEIWPEHRVAVANWPTSSTR
ncbi:MAG: hypothetical protein MUE52_05360 [Tabrizicola sp.]|jgi:hypothetical protein|nr:hypothetical protein [Tabrizicola sp.]